MRLYCPLLSQLGICRAYRSSRGPRLSLKGILDILSRIWSSSCWHRVLEEKQRQEEPSGSAGNIWVESKVCPAQVKSDLDVCVLNTRTIKANHNVEKNKMADRRLCFQFSLESHFQTKQTRLSINVSECCTRGRQHCPASDF